MSSRSLSPGRPGWHPLPRGRERGGGGLAGSPGPFPPPGPGEPGHSGGLFRDSLKAPSRECDKASSPGCSVARSWQIASGLHSCPAGERGRCGQATRRREAAPQPSHCRLCGTHPVWGLCPRGSRGASPTSQMRTLSFREGVRLAPSPRPQGPTLPRRAPPSRCQRPRTPIGRGGLRSQEGKARTQDKGNLVILTSFYRKNQNIGSKVFGVFFVFCLFKMKV